MLRRRRRLTTHQCSVWGEPTRKRDTLIAYRKQMAEQLKNMYGCQYRQESTCMVLVWLASIVSHIAWSYHTSNSHVCIAWQWMSFALAIGFVTMVNVQCVWHALTLQKRVRYCLSVMLTLVTVVVVRTYVHLFFEQSHWQAHIGTLVMLQCYQGIMICGTLLLRYRRYCRDRKHIGEQQREHEMLRSI